jgi:hypothetical protein
VAIPEIELILGSADMSEPEAVLCVSRCNCGRRQGRILLNTPKSKDVVVRFTAAVFWQTPKGHSPLIHYFRFIAMEPSYRMAQTLIHWRSCLTQSHQSCLIRFSYLVEGNQKTVMDVKGSKGKDIATRTGEAISTRNKPMT